MAEFCIQCGAPLNGNKFCTQCGAAALDDSVNDVAGDAPDLSGFDFDDQTQVMPAVNSAPLQSSPAQTATTAYAQPAAQAISQPSPKKGMGTGAKVGIIAAACALGVGAGVALAILQPWASGGAASSAPEAPASSTPAASSDSMETSSSDDASTENQASSSEVPDTQNSAATGASSSASSQDSSAASSSDSGTTEINVNVNINGEAANTESGQSTSSYIIADSATRYLSRSELEGMSSDDLSRAQNEIWARHGRMFKNQWLQNYFNGQSWYSGTIAPDDFTSAYKSTDIEDANASLISEILSARGWDVNKAHPN